MHKWDLIYIYILKDNKRTQGKASYPIHKVQQNANNCPSTPVSAPAVQVDLLASANIRSKCSSEGKNLVIIRYITVNDRTMGEGQMLQVHHSRALQLGDVVFLSNDRLYVEEVRAKSSSTLPQTLRSVCFVLFIIRERLII